MEEVPETRYVQRPDGVNIAYQVFGAGPRNIVFISGFISHLDLGWTEPNYAGMLRRLGKLGRVAIFDKPGTGLSDPVAHIPTLEERAEDVRLVIDAAGMEKVTLLGFSEGASSAILLAVTAPRDVEKLVLYGAMVKGYPSNDEELETLGMTRAEVDRRWARIDRTVREEWGRGSTLEILCPSVQGPLARRFWAFFERASASPTMARGLIEAVRQLDVLPLLESVRVPTLVMHNVDDFAPVANGRLIAARIEGSRYVEMPGADHVFWHANTDRVMGEIEEFVAGARAPVETDRILATVLFTDVVGSTSRAAELGDARWRETLEAHEELVTREVQRHGGRLVKSMGDGHLSLFNGPARAINCALALAATAELPLRAGVHTGECEAMGEDVGGLAVHIGARVGALANPGEVLVSGTVKDLVAGAGFSFAERGEHELKGVPGRWALHAAGPSDAPPVPAERSLKAGDRFALRMASRAPHRMRGAARLAFRARHG